MSLVRSSLIVALTVAVTLIPRLAHALPTLARAIELARERAVVVAEAEGEVGAARAQMASARQSVLGNPYSDIQIDKGLGTSQSVQALAYTYFPLDVGGQRSARIDEAERLVAWRKLGAVDARAIAIGRVIAAYGDLVVGAARVGQSETGETIAREEARYMAGRLEAKDTTVYEKSLADAEVARWVQSRAEAELRYADARARFDELTGETTPPDSSAAAADHQQAAVAPPPLRGAWDEAFIDAVVGRSPTVQRLEAEARYWDASADRYRSERMPPVALELITGRGSLGEPRLGGGVVVTFPITRRYQGEIARAASGRTSATSRLAITRHALAARLEAARSVVATVGKAMAELDANGVPALERAVTASLEGYRAGKIELTRVLLARRDLALARARRLDLLEAEWHAYADLAAFAGETP